nr:L,D-transpeptidase family protein [Candidatus Rhodoblastus alkanivorans]
MVSFGSSAARLRTAAALAALIVAGAAFAQAQTQVPAPAPVADPAATPPAAAPVATPAAAPDTPSTAQPAAPPTPSSAAGPAAAAPAPAFRIVSTEPQGPNKPAINQAIRGAVARDRGAAGRLTAQEGAIRRAVDAYYAARGDAPVWLDHGQWTPQARATFEQLQRAPEDGLDLSAYRVFSLGEGSDKALALGDVALSQAVAAYAFQASGGRIDPARISKLIGSKPDVVSAARALDETSKSDDAARTLEGYNPRQSGYLALKAKLAELRAEPVAMAQLASADHGRRMTDAARVGSRRSARLEDEILTNMEFWRWLPRDLGADRIMVNVPEFTARLYRNNTLVLPVRVITGKPNKPTPLFSDKIQYIIVNPSWNVPQSIIRNEMMPHLAALRAQGYVITEVNGRIHVRQPPGERNALGRIKFVFPNDYAVYMHDTPTRNLFSASRRAFSHGCVRVDQPFKLAEDLLQPENGWTEARIKKLLGSHERRVTLPQPMPIHIVYFTATVDDAGDLKQFDDVYGYARKVGELLGLGGKSERG